jgi:hypothetical protein
MGARSRIAVAVLALLACDPAAAAGGVGLPPTESTGESADGLTGGLLLGYTTTNLRAIHGACGSVAVQLVIDLAAGEGRMQVEYGSSDCQPLLYWLRNCSGEPEGIVLCSISPLSTYEWFFIEWRPGGYFYFENLRCSPRCGIYVGHVHRVAMLGNV